MNKLLDQDDKKIAPSLCQLRLENCAELNIQGDVRTMEPTIWRATVKDAITGLEHVRLCAGRAPLLGWCIRKGIEQHVDADSDEGVSMELLCHIFFDIKNNLQVLRTEEV